MAFRISLNQLKAAVDDAMAKAGIIGFAELRLEGANLFLNIDWTGKNGPHHAEINIEDVYESKYQFYIALDDAVEAAVHKAEDF